MSDTWSRWKSPLHRLALDAGRIAPKLLLLVVASIWFGALGVAMAQEVEVLDVEDGPGQLAQEEGLPTDAKPIDEQLLRKVRLLQRKLNSDQGTQRDEAEKELLDLGPAVLDYLANEDSDYSAEFNARLRRVRLALEMRVAESIVKPKTLSLEGAISAQELATAVTEQTGNSLSFIAPEVGAAKVEVDWEEMPMFEALDQLVKQGKFSYRVTDGGITVYSPEQIKPQYNSHVFYDQGFRIAATSLRSYRDLQNGQVSSHLTLNLLWEPRTRLIKLAMPFASLKYQVATEDGDGPPEAEVAEPAEDAGSQPGQEMGSVEFGVGREQFQSTFEIPVQNLPADAREFDVSGELTALLAGRTEVFRFENLAKAVKEKTKLERSGIVLQFEGQRDDEYLTGFQLTISFADAKKALESHYNWVYENPVYLIDPEGNRHEALTVESAGQTENQSSMLFLFDKLEDPAGWKLEYHTPGILVETKVPFTIKNIRLP